MSAAKITLLTNRTTDGTDGYEPWQRNSGAAMVTAVGEINVNGTFDGASVGFFYSINGEDVPIHDASGAIAITDNTQAFRLGIPHGQEIKAVISSAGGSTDLICTVTELRAI